MTETNLRVRGRLLSPLEVERVRIAYDDAMLQALRVVLGLPLKVINLDKTEKPQTSVDLLSLPDNACMCTDRTDHHGPRPGEIK